MELGDDTQHLAQSSRNYHVGLVRKYYLSGSRQGPEYAHIDLLKSVAHLLNNKDVFFCILRYHCRRGLVQQYEQMLEDMLDANDGDARNMAIDHEKIEQALSSDRNFSIACQAVSWGSATLFLRPS